MASLRIVPNRFELPNDKYLLKSIWNELEWAADNPDELKPPPMSRPDRLLHYFFLHDSRGHEYGFTVHFIFHREEDVLEVTVLAWNRSENYPRDRTDT